MKITMRTLSAGPQGTLEAGKTYDVEDKFAKELVAGGYAIPAGKTAPAVEFEPVQVETTVAIPAPEKAVTPRGKATGKVSVKAAGRSKKG
ncbi:MAG: hypothetical protein Q8O57_06530 [Kiritimatiellota bacterium]|nr:hypothetical protein [Kiritimatiellota bacterium]